MKTLVRLLNGKEISRKSGYSNEVAATNAGNSWKLDCTIHAKIRENRSFLII